MLIQSLLYLFITEDLRYQTVVTIPSAWATHLLMIVDKVQHLDYNYYSLYLIYSYFYYYYFILPTWTYKGAPFLFLLLSLVVSYFYCLAGLSLFLSFFFSCGFFPAGLSGLDLTYNHKEYNRVFLGFMRWSVTILIFKKVVLYNIFNF